MTEGYRQEIDSRINQLGANEARLHTDSGQVYRAIPQGTPVRESWIGAVVASKPFSPTQ
jgi:hypothetical protein